MATLLQWITTSLQLSKKVHRVGGRFEERENIRFLTQLDNQLLFSQLHAYQAASGCNQASCGSRLPVGAGFLANRDVQDTDSNCQPRGNQNSPSKLSLVIFPMCANLLNAGMQRSLAQNCNLKCDDFNFFMVLLAKSLTYPEAFS